MLKNFRELKVWQKSYGLCLELYGITKKFQKEEKYGLTSQIRRSAMSIPSNIAEGYGRKTTADYLRSLYIAYGSVCELETQVFHLVTGLCPVMLGSIRGSASTPILYECSDLRQSLKAI